MAVTVIYQLKCWFCGAVLAVDLDEMDCYPECPQCKQGMGKAARVEGFARVHEPCRHTREAIAHQATKS